MIAPAVTALLLAQMSAGPPPVSILARIVTAHTSRSANSAIRPTSGGTMHWPFRRSASRIAATIGTGLLAALSTACQSALRPTPSPVPAQSPASVRSPASAGVTATSGKDGATTASSGRAVSASTGKSAESGVSAASTNGIKPRIDPVVIPVPTEDQLAKTVTGVFGDSALLVAGSTEPEFDIDVRSYEAHARVMHYVQVFSGSGRERTGQRLSRGTRYEPMIRAKLSAAGLPEDLTYLALIESGYDPHAYSRAAAVGMWQFMTATAKDVGMRVDWWMDERRDPARATDGAIKFLGYLQRQFGSLYLAAAAYNGGPGRVARGLTRFAGEMEGAEGDDRFFALADQDYLHSETKNYVPQLIAAALVAKSPARYGISIDTLAPYAYDSVFAPPGTSLAAVSAASGATVAELRSLNPAILRGVTPPDASVYVRIPVGFAERAAADLETMSPAQRVGYTSLKTNGKKTLATIAKTAGISTQQLRWFNPALRTSSKTGRPLAGQTMRIPKADALTFAMDVPDPKIEKYGTTAARSRLHVVRSGESLSTIARRYSTTVSRLKSINRMKGDRIIAGKTIRVR